MEKTQINFKFHIKKGDKVKVISGDAKGKEGVVIFVDTKNYRAIVEGLNMVVRHVKPSAQNTEGGIIKKEAPIRINKLMLIDPKTGKPTRIGRQKQNGKTVRISKKSGQVI